MALVLQKAYILDVHLGSYSVCIKFCYSGNYSMYSIVNISQEMFNVKKAGGVVIFMGKYLILLKMRSKI